MGRGGPGARVHFRCPLQNGGTRHAREDRRFGRAARTARRDSAAPPARAGPAGTRGGIRGRRRVDEGRSQGPGRFPRRRDRDAIHDEPEEQRRHGAQGRGRRLSLAPAHLRFLVRERRRSPGDGSKDRGTHERRHDRTLFSRFGRFLGRAHSRGRRKEAEGVGHEHEEIHEDSQFPKVVTLDDQSVLVFSSIIGEKKCLETKLDKKGEYIYGDIPHTQGLSGSDLLTSPHDGTNKNSILFHHGDLPYEMVTTYNQNTLLSSVKEPKSRYFAHKSIVALKSGKIVIAGIVGGSNENVLTDVDINIYDPTTQTFGTGLTFGANGKLVSCYEHKENQVYCAFVSQQYPFVSKLILQHIEVNSNANTMASKSSQVIKTFYTVFNYLKAVPFSDTQAIILFRVGNGEALPKYGNSGQDLFFYQYELSNEEGALVKGIRYESLVKVYESNKNDPSEN